MKKIKTLILSCLLLTCSLLPTMAGTFTITNLEVYALSATAETGPKTLTENSNIGLDVKLNSNGGVADKVIFWTTWSYSDTRKSNNVTATEGSSSVRSMNLNNEQHASGDSIRINLKMAIQD
ncbi:MAG: hypothetical protein RR557_07495 [Bacilli bacterium]